MGKIHLAEFWIERGMKRVKINIDCNPQCESTKILSSFSLVKNILLLPTFQ